MALLEKQLVIKRSKIPAAGKGLFTKKFIAKGTRIVEYKGRITSWKAVSEGKTFNGYVYYINRNYVIDAKPFLKAFARYSNDASGLTKTKDLKNNTKYVQDQNKVYMEAVKDIPAGKEILVGYGKEYWDVIKYNQKLSKEAEKNK